MTKTIKLSGNFAYTTMDDATALMDRYNWDTIVHYMDDDIREAVHTAMAPCRNDDFLLEYMRRHKSAFGTAFGIN